ncbi:MAG TPA: ethanolamine permease [Ilumatobacteraceae bacterium]|nr:ethanolamine permease [Ilumatobacteraceae bacterium]
MEQSRRVGTITYRDTHPEYFAQRLLRRHAGVWSLWALGVAAVISGDFFGWNFGLAEAGFGGLLIATAVVTVMYFGLCYSIAEMSPALPHTGGAYSFSRSALGPWGGFATGVAETIEYVVTPAVIVFGIGSYMQSIFIDLFDVDIATWIWWAIFYVLFVALNVVGIEVTMRFTVVICVVSLAILVVFWVGALFSDFSIDRWANNIEPEGGNSKWLPFGIDGVFFALPFAIWFYLAIEELPLAAEESHDPKRDIPRATIYGLLTLVVAAVLTLFLNSGIEPGSAAIGESGEPLLDGLKTIFGTGTSASLLGLVAVTGLVASFHTIIFAYGRNIYSLSRAGYYPHPLSVTHGKRQTPYVALVLGGVIGYGLTLLLDQGSKHGWLGGNVGGALLYMAVFGAVISYATQCLSFIILRRRMPHIERPYRSPLGQWGAAIAAVIALVSLVAMFWNDDYRPGVYGVAIFYLVALAYFSIAGRHRLVLSPEEEFAVTRGAHGHPEKEGYGATHIGEVADATAPDATPAGT